MELLFGAERFDLAAMFVCYRSCSGSLIRLDGNVYNMLDVVFRDVVGAKATDDVADVIVVRMEPTTAFGRSAANVFTDFVAPVASSTTMLCGR